MSTILDTMRPTSSDDFTHIGFALAAADMAIGEAVLDEDEDVGMWEPEAPESRIPAHLQTYRRPIMVAYYDASYAIRSAFAEEVQQLCHLARRRLGVGVTMVENCYLLEDTRGRTWTIPISVEAAQDLPVRSSSEDEMIWSSAGRKMRRVIRQLLDERAARMPLDDSM